MISNKQSVCLVLKSSDEIAFYSNAFRVFGFSKITTFDNAIAALDAILKQSFDIFVIRQEMTPMPGLTIIQKMRDSGQQGAEKCMMIVDRVDYQIVDILSELEIVYVLQKPFTFPRFEQKFIYMRDRENKLPVEEQRIRAARIAFAADKLDVAEQMISTIAEYGGYKEKVLILRGDIHKKKNERRVARDVYEAALVHNPRSVMAANRLIEYYLEEKNFVKAVELCDKHVENNPFHIGLLENAGVAYLETGKNDKTLIIAGAIRQIDPMNKAATEMKARVYIAQGNFDKLVEALIETHNDLELVTFLNNEGVKLSKSAKFDKALGMYKKCLEKIGDNRFIYILYFNLAAVHKKMDDIGQAKEYLRLSLQINPKYTKAQEALVKLTKSESEPDSE